MKLDFLHLGGGGSPGTPLPRESIERAMRRLDIRPLDDAHRTIKVGLVVAAIFVAIFVAFATFAPISAAAIAPGEVSVSGDKVAIQPVTGGIVTQVLVREGQAVRAGQPLIRLNGVRAGASLTQAQARWDGLKALEARLLAERDGATALAFPPELTRRGTDPVVAQALATQNRVFQQRRAVLGADRSASGETITSSRAALEATRRQLSSISDELRDYRGLYRKGFARLTTIRSLERTQAQLTAELVRAQSTLNQAEISGRKLVDGQALDFASQLGQVQEQLAQVTPQLDVTRYVADQDVIRAPAAGRVSGIRPLGAGMVVGGGSTLMEIVPSGRALIIEARVKPQDIDDVRVGQPATVRFSSVNPHGKTTFEGRVVTLSPARIEQGGQSFYKAQVTIIDPAELAREGVVLQPGIPASATIKTEDRSLFDYLLSPLTDAISRSFREE